MAEWIVEITDGVPHTGKMTPLVRCKDCKHFMPYTDIERAVTPYKDTDGICHGGYPRANDFFCAGGERKTDTH